MKEVQMFKNGYFNYPAKFKDVLDNTFNKEIKSEDNIGYPFIVVFKPIKVIIYSIDINKLKEPINFIGKGLYSGEIGQPVTIPIYIREYLGINDNKKHMLEIEIKPLNNPF